MEVDGSILKLDMDFSNLSKISRKKLIDLIEYKKVKKGELIYPSSDSPENFYINELPRGRAIEVSKQSELIRM